MTTTMLTPPPRPQTETTDASAVRRNDRTSAAESAPSRTRVGWPQRTLGLAGAFLGVLIVFFLFVRPWYLAWGATDAELRAPLPGDEIFPNAVSQETRAITIRAPVDRVWPWLAQLGQDRGGFYSFDLLENLVGCEMPTTDVLRPEKQHWQLGDKLWMYPPDKAGGAGFATLRSYVPGRALGFGGRAFGTPLSAPEDGSWSFALVPLGDSATRFLLRGRAAAGRSLVGVAFDRSIFEPAHYVMERRTMIGVAQLAEGVDRQRVANHVHVALWTIMFGIWIAAAVMVLRARDWLRALAGFVAAAAVFQVLTFRQPPLVVGVTLVAAVAAMLWWPARRSDRSGHFRVGW